MPRRRVPGPFQDRLATTLNAAALAWLLPFAGLSCESPSGPSTSSSSHWIKCASDADCSNLPMPATCSAEGYCVDASSERVEQALSYETDFGSNAWDPEALTYETGFRLRNDDDQYYTDRQENVALQDGELVLTALAEAYDEAQYTSGSVETRGLHEWTFGRVEANVLVPAGRGVGPAFLMLPADPESSWPAGGDITIMSLRSEAPDRVLSGINYATPDGNGELTHHADIEAASVAPTAADDYHTYAIEWGPRRIDWFIDSTLVRSVALTADGIYHPQGQNPFHRPFYLKLYLAVGGLSEPPVAEDYPQEMRVRWIRVSQYR